VAYDGSEPSKHAVNQGARLAQLTESEITILSVVPVILIPVLQENVMDEESISAREMTNYQQQMKEHYSKSLKSAVDEDNEKYPEFEVESNLIDGKPSSTIVEVAEARAL
jgi:nucleotide-binding universal stress UspA family protein